MMRLLSKNRVRRPKIDFTAHVWIEGPTFVSYSPELDISSCGDSVAEARAFARSGELVPGRVFAKRDVGNNPGRIGF